MRGRRGIGRTNGLPTEREPRTAILRLLKRLSVKAMVDDVSRLSERERRNDGGGRGGGGEFGCVRLFSTDQDDTSS